jgi:hypothetical protein
MKADITEALKVAGVDESDIPGLLDKIQQAIAELTASGAPAGGPDALKKAVEKVLEESGVDVAKFDAAMKARRPQGPPPPPPGGASALEEEGDQNLFDLMSTDATGDTEDSLLELLLQRLNDTGSLFDATA